MFQSTVLALSSGWWHCGVEGPQQVEAVVELVVAEGGGVVADGVHGLGHGVHGSAGDRLDLGVVVRERRALDGVTGVEGDGVAGADLLADHLDEGRGLGDADVAVARVVVLGVLVVVPVVDVAVQVGGAENGERVLVLAGLGLVARGGLRRACSGDAGHADASHGGHGQQLAAGGLGLGDGAEGSGRAARHVTPGGVGVGSGGARHRLTPGPPAPHVSSFWSRTQHGRPLAAPRASPRRPPRAARLCPPPQTRTCLSSCRRSSVSAATTRTCLSSCRAVGVSDRGSSASIRH